MSIDLKEMKKLYDFGFALIYIRPKSKVPLESGWTTGERHTWDYLKKNFNPKYNLGVRLGTPSKIGENKYLAVIDVDVKSRDPRHRKEAIDGVEQLLRGVSCPVVNSGRGGGSCHYYCVTREPFKTFNAASSNEVVKVHMPSKTKISKNEREKLSEDEIKKGIRLAAAWEISLYSEGRQVVLPPSTHPDSGKNYAWRGALETIEQFRVISFDLPSEKPQSVGGTARIPLQVQEDTSDFTPTEIELDWLEIPETIRDLVKIGLWKGETVQNRSDFLLCAASALLSHGLSRNDILTILTERTFFLGEVAYEHAKTDSRERAAKWIWNYTLKKAIAEKDTRGAFMANAPIESAEELSADELSAQDIELKDRPEERGFYTKGERGALKPDYEALMSVFERERPFKTIADMKSVFTFQDTHYHYCTPIEVKAFAEKMFLPRPDERIRSEFYAKLLANNVRLRSFFTESTEGKINFKNGVLDLNVSQTELLPHSPEYGFRGVLP